MIGELSTIILIIVCVVAGLLLLYVVGYCLWVQYTKFETWKRGIDQQMTRCIQETNNLNAALNQLRNRVGKCERLSQIGANSTYGSYQRNIGIAIPQDRFSGKTSEVSHVSHYGNDLTTEFHKQRFSSERRKHENKGMFRVNTLIADYNRALQSQAERELFRNKYDYERLSVTNSGDRIKDKAIEQAFAMDNAGNYLLVKDHENYLVFPYFSLVINQVIEGDLKEIFEVKLEDRQHYGSQFEIQMPAEFSIQGESLKKIGKGKLIQFSGGSR